MRARRCSPLAWMSLMYSLNFCSPSRCGVEAAMKSEKPMMALSGVRSSWLMLARKLDFAWLASSASRSRALSS